MTTTNETTYYLHRVFVPYDWAYDTEDGDAAQLVKRITEMDGIPMNTICFGNRRRGVDFRDAKTLLGYSLEYTCAACTQDGYVLLDNIVLTRHKGWDAQPIELKRAELMDKFLNLAGKAAGIANRNTGIIQGDIDSLENRIIRARDAEPDMVEHRCERVASVLSSMLRDMRSATAELEHLYDAMMANAAKREMLDEMAEM